MDMNSATLALPLFKLDFYYFLRLRHICPTLDISVFSEKQFCVLLESTYAVEFGSPYKNVLKSSAIFKRKCTFYYRVFSGTQNVNFR